MILAIIQESACPLPFNLAQDLICDASTISEAVKKIQEMRVKIYSETIDEKQVHFTPSSNCQTPYIPYLFPNYKSPWLSEPYFEYPKLCQRRMINRENKREPAFFRSVYDLHVWKLYRISQPPYLPYEALCLWNPHTVIRYDDGTEKNLSDRCF